MNYTQDLINPEVITYFKKHNLDRFLTLAEKENMEFKYKYTNSNFAVDPNNKIPYPPDIPDLVRIHKLIRSRKCFTILEFGIGYSTLVMADALLQNKKDYYDRCNQLRNEDKDKDKDEDKDESNWILNIRCNNPFEIHSVDASQFWVDKFKSKLEQYPKLSSIINLHYSEVHIGTFNYRICHYYEELPDIVPDFIYLDGPAATDCKGDINGLSFTCLDRTVMSADILAMEPILIPGTFILIDGRTNNARFLKNNFQRNFKYNFNKKEDINTFELIEEPIGKYNENKLRYCLNYKVL